MKDKLNMKNSQELLRDEQIDPKKLYNKDHY